LKLLPFFKEELLGFVKLFFPPTCPVCRSHHPLRAFESGLCDACLENMRPLSSPCCTICCLPYEGPAGSDHRCESCLKYPPPFSRVIAFGVYTGLLREAVHRFKYEEAFYLHRPLGRLMATAVTEKLQADLPDLIIPVPLHLKKLRERTYNQSLLLARTLGKTLKIPVKAQGLERTRPTLSQQGLKSEERKRNLKGAFSLNEEVKDKRILLVDDVLTTGTTARECSHILIKSGARDVYVVVLARAAKYF